MHVHPTHCGFWFDEQQVSVHCLRCVLFIYILRYEPYIEFLHGNANSTHLNAAQRGFRAFERRVAFGRVAMLKRDSCMFVAQPSKLNCEFAVSVVSLKITAVEYCRTLICFIVFGRFGLLQTFVR